MLKLMVSPCAKDAAVMIVVTGAAFIVNPPVTVADAPYWSTSVTTYVPGVRLGTENAAAVKAPVADVGPKRLSVAVLFTTVVPKDIVTLDPATKLVPVTVITWPTTPEDADNVAVGGANTVKPTDTVLVTAQVTMMVYGCAANRVGMVYGLENVPVVLEVPEAICVVATPVPAIVTVYAVLAGILPAIVTVMPVGPLKGVAVT